MFCSNCGAEAKDGAAFCPKCGSPLTAPQPTAPAAQEVPAQPSAPQQSQPAPYVPQQPQAGYGYQPGVPATPPRKRRPPISAIVIAAITILAVASCIAGGMFRGGGSSEPDPGAPVFPPPYLDFRGNPTFHAMTVLSGSELNGLLEDEGWDWDDDKLWFISPDGNDVFYVYGPEDYEYTYDDIDGIAPNGAGKPIAYVLALDDRDYASTGNALDNFANYGVEKVEWLGDDESSGLATAVNADGERQLLLINYNDDPGLYVINVFNDEAVAQGMVAEWLGDDYGRSVDEIWEAVLD